MDEIEMNNGVSVIIPVYNGEPFVARAIMSVLNQTYPIAEIIVVNDGSTDRTLHVLQLFGKRINVISTPNRGVSSARNTGIEASTGNLIAFLDADDVWHDDKIERQVACLEQDPAAGLCCCDYLIDDGKAIKPASHFEALQDKHGIPIEDWKQDPLRLLIKGNFVGTTSAVLIKRDVLDLVGLFKSRYKQAEDYDLWLRCARVAKLAIQPAKLMRKIAHESNLTNNQLEMYEYHEMVLENYAMGRAFRRIPDIQKESRLELADIRYQIANIHFERGHYADSVQYFIKGLNTDHSTRNFFRFVYHASRKCGRIMSLGMMRNRLA